MKFNRLIKYLILVASIALIIAGVITGEAQSVLSNATRICLECIGIG